MAERRWRRLLALIAVASLGLLPGVQTAGAAESDRVALTATINTRDVDRIDTNRPLRLRASTGAVVRVQVTNKSNESLTVRIVRLHGKVLNLTFYTYDTLVDMRLDPGESDTREFFVDLSDLRGQATGLLPGMLTLLDQDRHILVSAHFPVDVRGSLASVYGVFGCAVGCITILLLVAALIRLAAQRLPRNRWKRATRFAVPGIGLGLVLTFSLSALRIFIPDASKWLTLVVIGGVAGFVIGYLTPTPPVRYVYDEEDAEV